MGGGMGGGFGGGGMAGPGMGGGGMGGQAGMGLSPEDIKEAFREFDLDKNGYVGAAEIAHILASVGEKATDDEIDEMIAMADLDGDGQISYDEFFKLISSFTGPPPPMPMQPAGGMAGGLGGGMGGGMGGGGGMVPGGGGGGPPPGGTPQQDLESFQKMHGLSGDALKSIYKRFMEGAEDKTGKIDLNKFCRLLRTERSPFVERLFGMFDTDRSGTIDLREFVIGLTNVGNDARDNKVEFAFKVFDTDGNGTIDVDELKKIVKATNMASAKQLDRKVKWLLSQCDKNNDGQLTFEEFSVLAKKFPNIVFPAFSLANTINTQTKTLKM